MSESDNDGHFKFRYLSDVLIGFRDYDIEISSSPQSFIEDALDYSKTHSVQRKQEFSSEIDSLLKISWQTELAAKYPAESGDSGFERAMAHTLPINVYYAIFNSMRAFALSEGRSSSKHSGIQGDFRSRCVTQFFGSIAFVASGDLDDPNSLRILPGEVPISRQTSTSTEYSSFERLSFALKTGRKWHLAHHKEEFLKARKTKILRGKNRNDFLEMYSTTSVLDLVYQMRRHANYEDVDFYGAEVNDQIVDNFYLGLIHLLNSTLCQIEAKIVQRIGSKAFLGMADRWTTQRRRTGHLGSETQNARFELMRLHLG